MLITHPQPIRVDSIPHRSQHDREAEEATLKDQLQQQLFQQARRRAAGRRAPRPAGYERPAFNTPQYWLDCSRGWISEEQQGADHAGYELRRKRAVASRDAKAPAPHRHDRAAPRPSKQFSKSMSTQAARDDRLTPQSKALLQVIVARTGQGRFTDSTKTTLGMIMNRCPRSIQRYLGELVRFGYLRTQTIKSRRTGFYIGLRIWVMNCVLPFFSRQDQRYDAQRWVAPLAGRRNSEETEESHTKDKDRFLRGFIAHKPPWLGEFAFAVERLG